MSSLRSRVAFYLPLCVVILLSLANVVLSGQMVSRGERMRAMENTLFSLNQQQKELETTLASLQSLQHMREEAVVGGFMPITSVSYLGLTRPVALR